MSKGRTKAMRLCPENCIYRNHEARFCGYCLIEIIDDIKKKEDANGNHQSKTEDTDKALRQGVRYAYLKVYVKKQVLNRNDAEDVTQNKPAKDGDVFTDEGLYTITVEDPATKQTTTKTIYVVVMEILIYNNIHEESMESQQHEA